MVSMTPFQKTCATLGMLTEAELIELSDLIDELLEVNYILSDDELAEDDVKLKRAAKGYIEHKRIRGYGPYAYLRRWKGKHLTSTYLGKSPG